jgi:predicted MFS family arabinose efflux permease
MVATNVGPQKRDGALNRGAVNVLAVVAAVAVANGYYIQPLLNEVGREMALPHVLLGILPAATQIGLAIGLVLLMPLADAHARRVLLIVVPLQIAALLLVAASGNVWMLAAGCFAIGLFGITPYVLPPYASVRVSSGLLGRTTGVLTGGVICGILLARTVAGFIAVHSGWRSVYVLAAAAMACVLFFMARLIRRQASAPITTSYRRLLASLVHLVRSQPALRTAALCQAFSFGSFNVFWLGSTFYLHARFGWKPDAIGSVGIVGAVAALSAPLFGRATQRFGAQRTRFIALVAVVISWGMLAILRESLAGMAVALIILDVATTVGDISNRTIIYALAPEIRTRLNAVYTIAMFVGGGTMSLLVGLCWTLNAWSGLCLLGAASALVSLLLAQSSRGDLMRSRWQKRAAREEPALG